MNKRSIEILKMSDPFTVNDDPRFIYRVTEERHRDGRVRRVLRGRDLRPLMALERTRAKYPNVFRSAA